jgi:hypothetical protein
VSGGSAGVRVEGDVAHLLPLVRAGIGFVDGAQQTTKGDGRTLTRPERAVRIPLRESTLSEVPGKTVMLTGSLVDSRDSSCFGQRGKQAPAAFRMDSDTLTAVRG